MKIALFAVCNLVGTLVAMGAANIPTPPVPEASTSGALAFVGILVVGTLVRRRQRNP